MKTLCKNFSGIQVIFLVLVCFAAVSCSHDLDKQQPKELSLTDQITNLEKTVAAKETLSKKEIALLDNLKEYAGDQKPSVSVGKQNHSFSFDDLSRTHVEFNAITEPPVFEACENAGDPDAKRECVAARVAKFVAENYDLSAGKDLKVAGIHEIDVSFVIDTQGTITNIKTRYAEPSLEREAERVIKKLPKMIPGKHKGKPMAALYSLPILYKVPR